MREFNFHFEARAMTKTSVGVMATVLQREKIWRSGSRSGAGGEIGMGHYYVNALNNSIIENCNVA